MWSSPSVVAVELVRAEDRGLRIDALRFTADAMRVIVVEVRLERHRAREREFSDGFLLRRTLESESSGNSEAVDRFRRTLPCDIVLAFLSSSFAVSSPCSEDREPETCLVTCASADLPTDAIFLFLRTALSLRLSSASAEPEPPNISLSFRLAPARMLVLGPWALRGFVRSSFVLGPRMPRQLGVPQRHSWTFLREKGLISC